jgi:EAL domain-containing protein (putative c-di-GMP-specific phosphodiesterase class I)
MAILESIVQLGTALEVDIVAEGVETQAQFEKLRDMRCGHVQGYLLSRPLSVEDMTARLGRGPESPVPRYPAT